MVGGTMLKKENLSGRIFDIFNYGLMGCLILITLYPCYYVLVASVSDPVAVYASKGMLFYPKGFSLSTYRQVLENNAIWIGYKNTIIYVAAGGTLSVLLTITAAYGLTRKGVPGQNALIMMIVFTMYFSGGMIPTYMVVKSIGILDTRLSMILPGAITTYNLIIAMSYFRGIPYELEEAAKIDGANAYQVLWKIMLPLAKPIVAVISLYYMVSIWNGFYNALLYLYDQALYPLQLILREILIQGNTELVAVADSADNALMYEENLKYAIIVVSTVPILCVYPFIQRYFVKGVMIGAVKG